MSAVRTFALIAAAALAAACTPAPAVPPSPAVAPAEASAMPFTIGPAPLATDPAPTAAAPAATPQAPSPPVEEPEAGAFVDLPVPGHAAAVVVVPRAGRRPVVVATHGAGGTPEAHCANWRDLIAGAAFVLCPRGVTVDVHAPPASRAWFYPAHPALEREVRAALAALAERFPDRVDLDRAVYAGFSQGATMGAIAFSRAPSPFTALVLVEGGARDWAMVNARSFAQGGGRRVLFACGRPECADPARRSAGYLDRAGVAVRVVDRRGAGHTYGGAVRAGLAEALPWLFEGDDRFAGGSR